MQFLCQNDGFRSPCPKLFFAVTLKVTAIMIEPHAQQTPLRHLAQ